MKIGDIVEGKISGIQPYGAFVELEDGNKGLIHISEIKTGFIDNIQSLLKLGQEVRVQVLDLDEYSKKVSLSLRTLEEDQHYAFRHRRFSSDRYHYGFSPLRRMMGTWIREAKSYLKEK